MMKCTSSILGLLFVGFLPSLASGYVDDSPLGAQNFEQNGLDRLHFRTPGRNFLLTFDFLPDVYNHSANYLGDVETSHSTRTRFPLTVGATLGLTDLWTFGITESYLFHSIQTNINDSTGVENTPSGSGLSDPIYRLNYRYLGGLIGSYFGDGFVNFSPSMGDNQIAGSFQDGNNLRGNTTVEVGTDLYTVVDSHEFSGGASWVYNTARTIDAFNSTLNESGSNYSVFDLRARYRYHFNEYVYAQAQGTFFMPYSTHYSFYNSANNRTEQDSFPFYVVPRVSCGVLVNQQFLLTAGLIYTSYTRSFDVSTPANTTSHSSVLHEVTLDVGASFLF